MMCLLQRMDADHRLTYGDLMIRDQTYVSLEPSIAYRKGMHSRIPAERYVVSLKEIDLRAERLIDYYGDKHRGMLLVNDVWGRSDIIIEPGNMFTQTTGNILVGLNRAPGGCVEYTMEAYWDIYRTLVDAMDDGDEVFLDVRNGDAPSY